MSDIFEEVDEEVRRDKAVEFTTKHQNKFLAVAVLIVACVAGYRLWDNERIKAAEAASAKFQAALASSRDGKGDEARLILDKLAAESGGGYGSLAKLASAAVKSKTDPAGAIAAYDALAADPSLGAQFQDAAKLRAALLRLDAGEADKARTTFEALAAPGGAYRHTAREMLGVMAISTMDYAGAGKWLSAVVADSEAPQQAHAEALRLLGLVASRATKVEPAKSEPAKSEAAKLEAAKSEPVKSEAAKTEPPKPEPAKPEPDPAKPESK